jgi:predicted CXXCH cytochrome family protein
VTSVRWVPIALGALLAGAALFVLAGPAVAQDSETCLACHTAPGMVLTLPSTEVVSVTIDPRRFAASAHGQALTCATCHPKNVEVPHPAVTARTLKDYQRIAAGVCATCHDGAVTAFASSVHGRAQRMGFPEAPTCVTCHNPHDASRVKTPAFRNNLPQLCGTCHADQALMRKYGLRPVYQTYINEFHGVTTTLYKLTKPQDPTPAAICTDCHGGHDIRAADDSASRVHPSRVLGTCQACHAKAGRFFATAWTEHETPGPDAAPLVWYVQLFYGLLIPATVAFVGVLTVLDLGRWATDQLRRGGKP